MVVVFYVLSLTVNIPMIIIANPNKFQRGKYNKFRAVQGLKQRKLFETAIRETYTTYWHGFGIAAIRSAA